MSTMKLFFLLLLSSCAVAQPREESAETIQTTCSKDTSRFKHFKKYIYSYEVETSNGIPGTADSQSGVKISCKAEVEVPQICSFILRTNKCTLREVTGVNADGKVILKKAKNSDDFAAAMSQYELKFTSLNGKDVNVYPNKNEPVHILNIKKGIISSFMAPPESDSDTATVVMDTAYGKCSSKVEVKKRNKNIATDIAVERDLSSCDQFSPFRDYVSPLALITGMNTLLSTLISSKQSCTYTFDPKRKHVAEAVCNEKHLFVPSSHKEQYGIMAQVKQSLKLDEAPSTNSRDFSVEDSMKENLFLKQSTIKLSQKSGDNVLKTLEDLKQLSVSMQNAQRASLFQKFVTGLRSLKNESLTSVLPKLMETSSSITLQALPQCGTPECYSAILQVLRDDSVSPLIADGIIYALGLMPSPCPRRVREVLTMAQYLQSRPSFYALSHTVRKFYEDNGIAVQEVKDVADFMASLIGKDCSGEEEKTYLTLKAVGNMGKAMESTNVELKSSLLKCIRNPSASLSVQKAAIHALRQMTLTDKVRNNLVQAFLDGQSPAEKRLAAYLILMKNPSSSDLSKVTKSLLEEKNGQVKNFVASHITNIIESKELPLQELKEKVESALNGVQVPSLMDFKKFSGNYRLSKGIVLPVIDPLSATVEGNLIFDPSGYMPREAMLETTLSIFGYSFDMFELGLEGQGFEPTLEALFGQEGLFPNSVLKTLYWADGKLPEAVSNVLHQWFDFPKNKDSKQELMREIMPLVQKLVNNIKNSENPEAKAYLRILGTELGYMKLSDFKLFAELFMRNVERLKNIPSQLLQDIMKGIDSDLFAHYIFMDNEFTLPTGAGLQLKFSLSGTLTPGAKIGLNMQTNNMLGEISLNPSVSVDFATHMGILIPEFTQNGVEMNTNLYHESGVKVVAALKDGSLKISIPSPTSPTKLFSLSNKLSLLSTTKSEVIPPLIENRQSWTSCRPFFTGLNYCTIIQYSNASSTNEAPYYPLTGESSFDLELQPTGEVKEYSATLSYEPQKVGNEMIDTLKLTVQAEGVADASATIKLSSNRNRLAITGDLQVPKLDVDYGIRFGINDDSTLKKTEYMISANVTSRNIPELILLGRARNLKKGETLLHGMFSVPNLNIEAKAETLVRSDNKAMSIQFDTSYLVYQSKATQQYILRYDGKNIVLSWNQDAQTNIKKLTSDAENLLKNVDVPDISEYSKALQKYADNILDQKVASTDMTLRHIASQSVVAANNWLQMKKKDFPYAATIQTHLQGLQELRMEKLGLPTLNLPEQFFLRSNGNIKYTFNINKMVITIPIPFGGKSLEELNFPKKIRTPSVAVSSLGLDVHSKEFSIPSFYIPETYQLHLPLLGVLEISAGLNSNYYNWSASFNGGNKTKDTLHYDMSYKVIGSSAIDILSHKLEGSAAISESQEMVWMLSYDESIHHRFLDGNTNLSVNYDIQKGKAKTEYKCTASSSLGATTSLTYSSETTSENGKVLNTQNIDGELNIASYFVKSTYSSSSNMDYNFNAYAGEAHTKLQSSWFDITNVLKDKYNGYGYSFTSDTNVQNGAFVNNFEFHFRDLELKIISDSKGNYKSLSGLNKINLGVSTEGIKIQSEYQADYYRNRYYTLISGTVDSSGLEINADITANSNDNKRAAYKGTLQINQNDLSTSSTTMLRYNSVAVTHTLNGGIDSTGATFKISTEGNMQPNNVKVSLDGSVTTTGIAITSVAQGTVFDVSGQHVLIFKVEKAGLQFVNTFLGSHSTKKIEYNSNLKIPGWSLHFDSKLDGALDTSKIYKHSFDLDLQRYKLVAKLNHNLKYNTISADNRVQLNLEPFKLNLNGDMGAAYGKDKVKHTYSINYADLTITIMSDSSSKLKDMQASNSAKLEIAGIAVKLNSDTRFDSTSLKFTNVLLAAAAPFTMTINAVTNGDTSINILGFHSGQLYSKLLFKAEPLVLTFSHDYRGSTTHRLSDRRSAETLLDSKVNTLLSPSEQSGSWKIKSKLNNNVYNQELSTFNDIEKLGVVLSGQAIVDLNMLDSPLMLPLISSHSFNLIDVMDLRSSLAQPQEFSISGTIQYDKNKDVRVINVPFIQNLPIYFDQIKGAMVSTLEAFQNFLKKADIDKYVQKYRHMLDKLPQQMNDYINELHLETSVKDIKNKLVAFTKDYQITIEQLQNLLAKVMSLHKETLVQLQNQLSEMQKYLADIYDYYDLGSVIDRIVNEIIQQIKSLDEQYDISQTVIKTLNSLRDVIQQYDQFQSSTADYIQSIEDKYHIKAQLQEKMEQLKAQIQSLDAQETANKIKEYLQSIDISEHIEKLKASIPFDKIDQVLEQLRAIIMNLMEEYEIADKINALNKKMQDIILYYNIDKQIQIFLDKTTELAKEYKIRETTQAFLNSLKSVSIKDSVDTIIKRLDVTIEYLKEYNYKKFIDQVNDFLDLAIKTLRSFDYNEFVDKVNNKILEARQSIYDKIKALDLPQKAEALKAYVNYIRSTILTYTEQLKDAQFAEIFAWVRNAINSVALDDLKVRLEENLEDLRNRISSINIPKEMKIYLQKIEQVYISVVNYISELWNNAAIKITELGEQYSVSHWANKVKLFVEEGFTVPEIKCSIINIPPFEVSLRALKKAEFHTPEFSVPLTDLVIPSLHINIRTLKSIEVPSQITTPAFTILNTYKIPSFIIDLNEIKQTIIRMLDKIQLSEFQIPTPELYFKDLKLRDVLLFDMSFPEINFEHLSLPDLQIPTITIPKLNLDDLQFPEIQIPEIKLPRIPHEITVPTFGKLHGTFKIASPFYTLTTTGLIQNATTIQKSPLFKASLSAQASSKAALLEFTLDCNAHLSAPGMELLEFVENVKLNHKNIVLNHEGKTTFSTSSLVGLATTAIKANCPVYTVDVTNNLSFTLQRGISFNTQTTYNLGLNSPQHKLKSELTMQNNIQMSIETRRITVTVSTRGNGKWSCPMYLDEGKHDSTILFSLDGSTAALKFSGDTTTKYLVLKQNVNLDSGLLSFVGLNMLIEMESPYIGSSIVTVKGKGSLEEMKTQLEISHNANLVGTATGKLANSLIFVAQPFEMSISSNNNGNMKIVFPRELTSKIDFENNYDFVLSSERQEVNWKASSRFNQYKYAHKMYLGNNADSTGASMEMNGAANLDFLNMPVDIPEIAIPYSPYKTPKVAEFSLWERTGLKSLLKTTRQSFDLNFKIQYKKNKDFHSFTIPLEALYKSINANIRSFNNNFEKGRDKALNVLTESYNQAKTHFDKFKIDTSANKQPRFIRIPGYTVPLLNIEVSPFTAELPAFGYFIPKEVSTPSFILPFLGFSIPSYTLVLPSLDLPVLYVPNTLRKLSLPKFKMPKIQNAIMIPAMGNMTYDFTFKSAVITLNANAGLYNQSDIVARFGASSVSTFETLNFAFDGTTSLTRKTGLKVATALSLNHMYIQAKHDSSVSLTKSTTDASITTTAKISCPVLNVNLKQELKGNPTTKPNVKSVISCDYVFSLPKYQTSLNGKAEHILTLEGLTSYFSIESTANGDVSGTILSQQFLGKLKKEANTYINAKGSRSAVKLSLESSAEGSKGKNWNLALVEDLALEASTQRIYAVWKHNSDNMIKIEPVLNTNGKQRCKATIEAVPWSLITNIDVEVNQPSNYMKNANLLQSLSLNINPEIQNVEYSGTYQINSAILSQDVKVVNNKTSVLCELAGSLQGHVNFLKSIVLPVYKKNMWEILKFGVTTSENKLQYLNSSAVLMYKKNKDGYFFKLPVTVLSDGVVINIPAVQLQVPVWVNNLRRLLHDYKIYYYENYGKDAKLTLPSVIKTPQFNVPFTTLSIPAYNIDLTKIKIPKKISTFSFDLSLPTLPKVKFIKTDIGAKYKTNEEYKIPYFDISIPKSGFTISDFTLPKTVSIGGYSWELDSLAKQIADFELPTVTIPEQKVEIPPLTFSWPAGLFIPTFGSLSGTIKIASPIYNVTWTTTLSNKTNSLEASLDATCSSTLQFLEFDIDANTAASSENANLIFKEKGSISHREFNLEWTEEFSLKDNRFVGRLTIVSPTFADVSMNCNKNSERISISVSSPAAGFMGLVLDTKNTDVLSGKLYTQAPLSSEEENIIVQGDISLENPEVLQIKAKWNDDNAAAVVMGLKDRIPKMSNAVYNCLNKYHREHFGMGINTASQKLKEAVKDTIDNTYQMTNAKIEDIEYKLHTAAKRAVQEYDYMKEKYREVYQIAADQAANVDVHKLAADFFDTAIELVQAYQKKTREVIEAVITFVKGTTFQVPGMDRKYTGEELYDMLTRQIPLAIDEFIQNIHNFMKEYTDAFVKFINEIEIKFPGSNKAFSGKLLLDYVKVILTEVDNRIREWLAVLPRFQLDSMLQQLKDYTQYCLERIEDLFKALKEKDFKAVTVLFEHIHTYITKSKFGETVKSTTIFFRENFSEFKEIAQKELLAYLDQISIYVKALREEFLDTNMVGWTVKYYEIEDNIVKLLQVLKDYLKEMGPKYMQQTAEMANRLATELTALYEKNAPEYYTYATDLFTNFERRGREKISELSDLAQTEIKQWAESAKSTATVYKEQVNMRLQDIYAQLFDSYDKFISEVKRLIDSTTEQCKFFFKLILELLQNLQAEASETFQVKTSKNELEINVHHSLN
ncbi:apolipoprotein B-100 [Protopterus annectens]|uniref:apolipoprotein B-100 n=1 Tax=Protopterus annectens TaxID=7888 RepID=UPI001CFA23BB|nr:apolipoprotein B-100 [Protopterus annectens]